MIHDSSRYNYLRPLNYNQSSAQNLLSIGAEVASVLPSHWFGKKPFPKQKKVSEYVEWVGFSRFASFFTGYDGDWNTFNALLKDKPVWKRWETAKNGEPINDSYAKKIFNIQRLLKYIQKLREIRDVIPWDTTAVVSPLFTSYIEKTRYYKMGKDAKGRSVKVFEHKKVAKNSPFPLVTFKKPSDCDREIKEIEKLLSAFYDEVDKRFRIFPHNQ